MDNKGKEKNIVRTTNKNNRRSRAKKGGIKSKTKGINAQYKDRLFKFIFGNPNKKEWTLSLYNAVNDTDYKDPDEIVINTIEDAVYMGMKNDLSFLIGNVMNMYEQQASYNPNMPLRFLIYVGMQFSKIIDMDDLRLYSSKLQKLPVPKCICFYNGIDEKPDVFVQNLSDAFKVSEKTRGSKVSEETRGSKVSEEARGSKELKERKDSKKLINTGDSKELEESNELKDLKGSNEPDIEVRVKMININLGHNKL